MNAKRKADLFRYRYRYLWFGLCWGLVATAAQGSERIETTIPTRYGSEPQPVAVHLPDLLEEAADDTSQNEARPLLVSLHTWSADWHQRNPELEALADKLGWVLLLPNFHGPNRTRDACGSEKAQQQILEAVRWACDTYNIDRRRIYLTGVSGGGHMTLLMAGRYPKVWAAASAWVGISDLAAWHQTHSERNSKYADDLKSSCGGVPGESDRIDFEYRVRSPVTYLAHANQVPLDIAAGIHDGHHGSVPVEHSLVAFNCVAQANNDPILSEELIHELSLPRPPVEATATKSEQDNLDLAWGRPIHFRRESGLARVTLFEGGHEGLAHAATEFLKQHAKESPVEWNQATLTPTEAQPTDSNR